MSAADVINDTHRADDERSTLSRTGAPPTFVNAAQDIWSIALPYTLSFAAYFSMNIIGQLFAGSFSVDELAGYGLSMMLINSMGFAVVTGLYGGLDTILSQAYGANSRDPKIAVYAQRSLVLFTLMTVVPSACLLLSSGSWMRALHVADDGVISAASTLLQLLTISIPLWVLSELVMTVLGCTNATSETFLATLAAAIVNPILLYLFVTRDWIGYQGLAIAHSANVLVLFSVQVLSAAYTGSIYGFYDGRWRLAEIFSGWKMILSLALPSMALMMCEWGAYEVNVLLSARFLTKHHFAAVAICQQLDNSLLACPLAVGTSLTIKVGNYVGAGDQDRAKRVAVAGVAMTAALALTGGAVLSLLRSVLPGLFTSDDVVKAVVEDTLPFVSIFFVADCMLGAWTCILRGLGLQLRAAAAAIVSWWLVGMPLGILLYHLLGASLGAKAFFIGPAAGLLLGNALCVYFVMTAEWIPLNAGDGKEPVEGES